MTTTTGRTTVRTHPINPTFPATGSTRRRVERALRVAAAVAVNSVLYVIARAAGTDFTLTAPTTTQSHPLILPEIAVFSLVFALLGWGALALLERYTRYAGAIWSVLAGAVLVASFLPVFIERATADTRTMLCLMHVVVAAALLPMLRQPTGVRASAR